jgi:hypothetical protein
VIGTQTVFVLGAGASQPYDLPLGSELFRYVIDHFGANTEDRRDFLSTTAFREVHIDTFIRALSFSGLTSVDAFLEKREEFIDIGKAMMAFELLKRESHNVLWGANGNWMQYLYAKMITRTLEEFGRNAVSFITYNYDRTLEHFLHVSLMNSYGKHEVECKNALANIAIIHLHGRLGYLPWQRERDAVPFAQNPMAPQVVEACLRELRIVHESIEDRNVEFKEARRLIREAKRLYFLGFGWAPQNIERLIVEDNGLQGVEGTAFGLTQAEQRDIRTHLKTPVTFQNMDCLTFLRERCDWS